MSPDFIDMAGREINGKHVLNRAVNNARRAYWWVRCLACRHEQQERGFNLRKAQKRPGWQIVCKGCGG